MMQYSTDVQYTLRVDVVFTVLTYFSVQPMKYTFCSVLLWVVFKPTLYYIKAELYHWQDHYYNNIFNIPA